LRYAARALKYAVAKPSAAATRPIIGMNRLIAMLFLLELVWLISPLAEDMTRIGGTRSASVFNFESRDRGIPERSDSGVRICRESP